VPSVSSLLTRLARQKPRLQRWAATEIVPAHRKARCSSLKPPGRRASGGGHRDQAATWRPQTQASSSSSPLTIVIAARGSAAAVSLEPGGAPVSPGAEVGGADGAGVGGEQAENRASGRPGRKESHPVRVG